jgi:hypothetical protein
MKKMQSVSRYKSKVQSLLVDKIETRENLDRTSAYPAKRLKTTGSFAIPLGAIAARKTLDKDHLASLVGQSLRWAYAHDAKAFALCRQHSQEFNPNVVCAHINLYVNSFSEGVGPEGHAAVDFFCRSSRSFGRLYLHNVTSHSDGTGEKRPR